MEKLKLNMIYPAFMGEVNPFGIGAPCTFVRLAGCNLRCYKKTKGVLCDTPEALDFSCGKEVSVAEIIDGVRRLGRKVVCLTGGEPLMQDVRELLTELSNRGYSVVVETNGSKSIAPYRHIRNVSFVVDAKSVSSGESEKMFEGNYTLLDDKDFVKFVIDTETDFEDFETWVFTHSYYLRCNIAVGLFWGSEITYDWLFERLKGCALAKIFVNMQTHKMACLYDKFKNEKGFSEIVIPKDL